MHSLQDPSCSVAFMPGNICYTVQCFSDKLCESIPANPSQAANGSVQISHIVRGGGAGDDVDEFRTKFGINKNRCKFFAWCFTVYTTWDPPPAVLLEPLRSYKF